MSARIYPGSSRHIHYLRKNLPTIVGFIIALGWPFWISPLASRIFPAATANPYLSHAGPWFATALLLCVVLLWEHQSLSSIGFRRPTWTDIMWGLASFVVGILLFIITTPIIRSLHLNTVGSTISQQMSQLPVPLGLFIAFTAGVTEEILYRGYPIERFSSLTGNLAWGAVISYIAFVLMHLSFWGIGGVIQIGLWALVPTTLYARRRNLYANILMHFLNDSFALVLMPVLLARYLR